jgi:hypothetical protein
MNDEPTVERTDDTDAKASPADQEPSANEADGKAAGRDLGTFVTAVGDAVQEIARDVAERAGPAVRDAATKAGPVVREASARAAEVAAKAADAAGPIAQKVATATGDVGHRVAERSREIATDLRRAAGGQDETNGHGVAGEVPAAAELPPVDPAGDATLN